MQKIIPPYNLEILTIRYLKVIIEKYKEKLNIYISEYDHVYDF